MRIYLPEGEDYGVVAPKFHGQYLLLKNDNDDADEDMFMFLENPYNFSWEDIKFLLKMIELAKEKYLNAKVICTIGNSGDRNYPIEVYIQPTSGNFVMFKVEDDDGRTILWEILSVDGKIVGNILGLEKILKFISEGGLENVIS